MRSARRMRPFRILCAPPTLRSKRGCARLCEGQCRTWYKLNELDFFDFFFVGTFLHLLYAGLICPWTHADRRGLAFILARGIRRPARGHPGRILSILSLVKFIVPLTYFTVLPQVDKCCKDVLKQRRREKIIFLKAILWIERATSTRKREQFHRRKRPKLTAESGNAAKKKIFYVYFGSFKAIFMLYNF